MKKKSIEKTVKYKAHELPDDSKTDWNRVLKMSDKELKENAESDEDTFLLNEEFFKVAKFVFPAGVGKEKITIRIDTDILQWLQKGGRGYQSRINAILRSFMLSAKERNRHSARYKR